MLPIRLHTLNHLVNGGLRARYIRPYHRLECPQSRPTGAAIISPLPEVDIEPAFVAFSAILVLFIVQGG